MTSRVLELKDVLQPDNLATRIADKYLEWDMMRQEQKQGWDEVRRYVFATDTTQTSNSSNPWNNKTVIPKLCQIRDNLYANYTSSLFPQRKNVIWEANESNPDSVQKRDSIQNYMTWVLSQPQYKHEMDKIILDYIDYGNCFATVEWLDMRVEQEDKTQVGYLGPSVRRISPTDIVFNPTAENFMVSPKIVRSMISVGELKELLQRMSNDENRQEYEELWDYLKELRGNASSTDADWLQDGLYQMDGFASYRDYLRSDYAEVLTFYGDLYDSDNDTFYKNHVITVVDRHKLIGKKPNPSWFGYPPIFHVAWRKRQDNLWGMGPLANLVGLQYRMNHVENLKADVFDLVTYPVVKVKGFVEDFIWQPAEKIFCGDEGDVEMVAPDVQALNANFEIDKLDATMEINAGAPREAVGFRTPGEKTKFEFQQLENAASRIFNSKIKQFDEQMVEPLANAKLELSRRNMTGVTTVNVFNDELQTIAFQSLTSQDITGIGRIKPVAARHFAEQAELIQNLTNLTNSPLWATVQPHFSGKKLAKILENMFNLTEQGVVMPFIALAEQAEGQKQANVLEQQVQMEGMTATGMGEDFDMDPAMMDQMNQQMAAMSAQGE